MSGALLDLRRVREAIAAGRVTWSRHGVTRMQERGITREDVLAGLRGAEVIENYPDDVPYPSALVLGFRRRPAVARRGSIGHRRTGGAYHHRVRA
jgi:hypothetical protein